MNFMISYLALTVGPVLVELDLDEVWNPQVLNRVLNVLVRRPPGQIPDVELAAFVAGA
jgi:hypothetical protein